MSVAAQLSPQVFGLRKHKCYTHIPLSQWAQVSTYMIKKSVTLQDSHVNHNGTLTCQGIKHSSNSMPSI